MRAQHVALPLLHSPNKGEGPDGIHRPRELRLRHGKDFEPGLVPASPGHVFVCCRRGRRTDRAAQPPSAARNDSTARLQPFAATNGTEEPNGRAAQAEAQDWAAQLGVVFLAHF